MLIRRLILADRAGLEALCHRIPPYPIAEPWLALDDPWRESTEERRDVWLRSSEECGEQTLLGAYSPTSLVGVVGLRRETRPNTCHKASLWGLYVAPEWRRQGIGGQLIDAIVQTAETLPGLEMLRLVVSAENAPTTTLLQTAGFQEYAREPGGQRLNGRDFDQTFWYRFLSGRSEATQ